MGENGSSKKQLIVNQIVNKVISLINKDVDIEGFQEKFNANRGKVIQGRLVDIDRTFHLQVTDGKIRRLKNPEKVDGFFETDCVTLISLFKGKIKVVNPSTMEEKSVEYTPLDAVRYGDIRLGGDASSNDLLLFATAVYKEAYPQVRSALNEDFRELNSDA